MYEVSREASMLDGPGGSGQLCGESELVGGSAGVLDMLGCNCVGDGGVHSSSLSIESCSATAIRMN
jgi:hypothetical protein